MENSYSTPSFSAYIHKPKGNQRVLRTNKLEKFIKAFRQFHSYLFTSVDIHVNFVNILLLFEILQLIVPSLLANSDIWTNNLAGKTVKILQFLIDPFHSEKGSFLRSVFALIISSFFILDLMVMFIATMYHYNKNTQIPKIITKYFDLSSMIASSIWPPLISTTIIGIFQSEEKTSFSISSAIILLISFTIFSIWHMQVHLASIVFNIRPFVMLYTWTCLSYSVSSKRSAVDFILIALLLISYGCFFFVLRLYGHFIRQFEEKLMFSTCAIGALSTFVMLIYNILHVHVHQFLLFVLLMLWIVIYYGYQFIITRRTHRCLSHLDYLDSSPDDIINFKDYEVRDMAIIEFRENHPYVEEFGFFNDVLKQRKVTILSLILKAKFLSIYPGSILELNTINRMVKGLERNPMTLTVKDQIKSLINQRDTGLTPALKAKIAALTEEARLTRLKIESAWIAAGSASLYDAIYQVEVALKSIHSIEDRFKLLLIFHNNNDHLLKAYKNF